MRVPEPLRYGLLVCGVLATLSNAAFPQAIRVDRRQILPQPADPVGSLSVSVSPSSVNFTVVPAGVSSGSNAIQVTTSWSASLCLFTCTVNLYGYFASANAALSGGSPVVNIPSSQVLGQMSTGTPTTYTAFTQSGPLGGAGASLLLFSQSIFLYTGNSSRTDPLNLEIDLTNQPQLPAGTYTGTLYIQAQTL
jgi:hypothetical protein